MCSKHCYNDSIHDPSIQCDICNWWVHHKCSKLTINQFNRFGASDDSYYCLKCVSDNLPFGKLSKSKLVCALNLEFSDSVNMTRLDAIKNCMLCIECNTECNECTICPDTHRICDTCSIACKYATIPEINMSYSDCNDKNLTVLHMNISSLTKYISELETLIFKRLNNKPHVICITETRLQNVSDDSKQISSSDHDKISLPGYDFFYSNSRTKAGGCGIYILNEISKTIRNDLEINIHGECEAVFVEIVLAKPAKNVLIGSIYRHPHDNYEEFFSAFFGKVEKIAKKYSVILLGDINLDCGDTDKYVKDYKDLLLSYHLKNIINLPTRITETSETIIDHVVTNLDADHINSGVLVGAISDHLPVFAVAKLKVKHNVHGDRTYIRKFSTKKKQSFISVLESQLQNNPMVEDARNPTACLQLLIANIQNAIDKVFPKIMLSKKKNKKFRKPWITAGIIKSMEHRDILLEKYIKQKDECTRKAYTRKRNLVTRICEKAKDLYFKKLGIEAGTDRNKKWVKLNQFLKDTKKPESNLPNELKIKNSSTILNDPQKIANHLNRQFVTKGPRNWLPKFPIQINPF